MMLFELYVFPAAFLFGLGFFFFLIHLAMIGADNGRDRTQTELNREGLHKTIFIMAFALLWPLAIVLAVGLMFRGSYRLVRGKYV